MPLFRLFHIRLTLADRGSYALGKSSSAVGFVAVAYGSDLDCVLVSKVEKHPVIATAETETSERRLELLYVAGAAGQVAIHAVENLQGGFAVDGAQISSCLRRPANRDPLGRGRLGHLSFTKAELAPDVFVGNDFSASE